MIADDLKGKRIAFAASGGLDSCTITHWLASRGVEVICITADIGQPDETSFEEIGRRMLVCGAKDFVGIPLVREMAEMGLRVIQAQARYEGDYWNTTGAGRVVTVRGIVKEMQQCDLSILGHGATGRGNDQVRFQVIAGMLDPNIEVYAPWRDPAFLGAFGGRQDMIAYCHRHGLPVRATADQPYSTDANLLGLTHEGGKLEHLDAPADTITPEMGVWPEQAAAQAQIVSLRFAAGRPVAFEGRDLPLEETFRVLNKCGGAHGIGIGQHLMENRFVGVKSRGVYEAPAMQVLGAAYAFLMQAVFDRRTMELFEMLSHFLARQLYQGYWEDTASHMARAAIARSAALVTGTIRISLYRGTIRFAGASDVVHSLYNDSGSMEAGGAFNHADSEGLVRILTLGAKTLARSGQLD